MLGIYHVQRTTVFLHKLFISCNPQNNVGTIIIPTLERNNTLRG